MKFAADENFDNDILRGLFRVLPNLDMVRVQDAGLSGIEDPEVLEWCARENRIFLTHDVRTITKFAYDRLEVGLGNAWCFRGWQAFGGQCCHQRIDFDRNMQRT